ELLEDLLRLHVALVREPNEPVGIGRRPERLARRLRRSIAAHVGLENAAPRSRALRRPAVVDEHRVSELGAFTVPAAEGRPAGDDSAADAGPEREHHEIVDTTPGARAPLADRRRVRVVVQPDRQTE